MQQLKRVIQTTIHEGVCTRLCLVEKYEHIDCNDGHNVYATKLTETDTGHLLFFDAGSLLQ